MALVTIKNFQKLEPDLGSVPAIRFKTARRLFDPFILQIGGRIYINLDAWETFKRCGGRVNEALDVENTPTEAVAS